MSKWLEVSVSLHQEAIEAVAEVLMNHGANGVEIDDPVLLQQRQSTPGDWDYVELPDGFDPAAEAIVRTWFPLDAEREQEMSNLLSLIETEIDQLQQWDLQTGSLTVSSRVIAEENWAEAWKAWFKPLYIGRNLLVKPSWEALEGEDESLTVIELDPGLAFGTGNHASTRLSLILMERYLHPGQVVIDVGCGSGILTVAAAKLGATRVLAVDNDPLAIDATKGNLQLNNLKFTETPEAFNPFLDEPAICVFKSDLIQQISITADLVVANIVADVIIRLSRDVDRIMNPGAVFICSGILTSRREDVAEALTAAGLTVITLLEEDDWVAIAARKT